MQNCRSMTNTRLHPCTKLQRRVTLQPYDTWWLLRPGDVSKLSREHRCSLSPIVRHLQFKEYMKCWWIYIIWCDLLYDAILHLHVFRRKQTCTTIIHFISGSFGFVGREPVVYLVQCPSTHVQALVKDVDCEGKEALHWAATKGHDAVAQILLASKAQVGFCMLYFAKAAFIYGFQKWWGGIRCLDNWNTRCLWRPKMERPHCTWHLVMDMSLWPKSSWNTVPLPMKLRLKENKQLWLGLNLERTFWLACRENGCLIAIAKLFGGWIMYIYCYVCYIMFRYMIHV